MPGIAARRSPAAASAAIASVAVSTTPRRAATDGAANEASPIASTGTVTSRPIVEKGMASSAWIAGNSGEMPNSCGPEGERDARQGDPGAGARTGASTPSFRMT